MYFAWFDCLVFETWQCCNEFSASRMYASCLLQDKCTAKVTSEH